MFCSKCGAQNIEKSRFCFSCGFKIENITSTINYSKTGTYAGLGRRVIATIFDSTVLLFSGKIIGSVLGFIIGYLMSLFGTDFSAIQNVSILFGSIIGVGLNWLYYTLFESSSYLATPGKIALGILVTDIGGNKVSFGRANARYWSKIFSGALLLFGFIMTGFTRKKQGLHDIIAGTIVTTNRNATNSNDPLVSLNETIAWALSGFVWFTGGLFLLLLLIYSVFTLPFQLFGISILGIFIFSGGIMMNDNIPAFNALRNSQPGTKIHLISLKLQSQK